MRRPPVTASIFALVGVVILCALGTWQVYRLQWKQDLLAKLDVAYAADANSVALDGRDFVLQGGKKSYYLSFKRGHISGTYLRGKAFLVGPRVYNGEPGYHVLVPFIPEGLQRAVLVDRGWVPGSSSALPKLDDIQTPEGIVALVGMVRDAPQVNSFVPKNIPEKEQWYSIDVQQMAAAHGLRNPYPRILTLEGNDHDGRYPIAAQSRIMPPNHHAQYAFFWFSMAVALVVIFVLRFMSPRPSEDDPKGS